MTSSQRIGASPPADDLPEGTATAASDAAEADDFALAEEVEALNLDPNVTERVRTGMEVIARFARTLPNGPGVYRMFDHKGDVLYVGKARSLRKRVQQYALGRAHTNRVARMIADTASMEFVTTQTETEALLLEANLIKQLRPRYNVLLRDDKSFPYILLTRDHRAPQILKHRGARVRKGDYFGPFASAGAVGRTIDALQRAFLLRSCSDSVFENRTRPCLLFQIKRCSGPCVDEISQNDYDELVTETRDFLAGRSMAVRKRLSDEMQAASEALEFERAARARDRLAAMSAIQSNQDINPQSVEEADVFAIHEEAGHFCVEVFFFRNFQNWGNRAFSPKADKSLPLGEVLGAFVTQFYDDKPTPKLILLSHEIEESELVADAFSQRAGCKVEIATPKRGEKRDLVAHAEKNAREALTRKLADTASQEKLLATLGAAFGLAKAPRRVEVYDNSHIMGTNAVGAMIVAGANGFMKTHYRTFNIKSTELTPGDDFGMMREVLQRRFSRLVKESAAAQAESEAGASEAAPADVSEIVVEAADDEAFPAWPDLVIIDGGKGQLEAARETLAAAGAGDTPLVAIAKGPDRNAGQETFHQPGRSAFKLPPRDPALYFIQRLRDEAHRFAIGTHRAKRKREMSKNPLDEIPGIGPRRKRALLLHFGTVKAIKSASLDDLASTPGVNDATAKAVYQFFQQGV
ncbi:excinuclease ABC subunit UvrC [Terrarubrum flagellatum]|uniref:excinuclease ABC subunit UvrC n=1 Tax=Terrirubrum flagellatum TaxID=2895980 RepID=UPI003144ED72